MKPISKYQGLVLKIKDYKENSSLVTVITPEFKQNYIVRGTKKLTSKTAKWINFLNNISFTATDTDGLNTMTEAFVLNSFPNIVTDSKKLEVSFVIVEKLDLLYEQATDLNKLYEFTLKILNLLEQSNYPMQILQLFEIKIMYLLGIAPNLNSCMKCNRIIGDEKFYFNVNIGGNICSKCSVYDEFHSSNYILNDNLSKVFKYLYFIKIDNVDEEFLKLIYEIEGEYGEKSINKAIDLYYQQYLDFNSKVKKVYASMKGEK